MKLIKYTIKAYNNFLTTNREVIVSIVAQNIILLCINKGL